MGRTVVRREHFGPLIWSDPHCTYFLPVTDADNRAATAALAALERGEDWRAGTPPLLAAELDSFGLDSELRFIDSPYDDRLSGPLECYFDYTWLCNLAKHKCGQDSFCYAAEVLGPTTMRPDKVRQFITELADWGVMRLHLAGGEPTINKRLLANYLDTATEAGLFSSMPTNGLLFDDEVTDIVLRNSMKSVSFSIDGATDETYSRVRGSGLFDTAIDNIRRFIARKNAAGSSVKACIKPTYEPTTPREELEALVRLAIDLGADVIKFANPERCMRHEQGHYGKTVDEYYDNMFFIADLQAKYLDQIKITNVNNPMVGCEDVGLPGMEGCIGGQELLTLNPDGSVTPCLMHSRELGNVLTDYETLREFWDESTVLTDFWGELRKPSGCSGCDIYSKCRSGSTTRRIVEVGKFDSARGTGEFADTYDPLCPRDYMERRPEKPVRIPLRRRREQPLVHFREVVVLHSL